MRQTLGIIDLGMGNLASVRQALERAASEAGVSCDVLVSADPDAIRRADRLIAPGQGAFRDCSQALEGGLGEVIRERIQAGVPYLGICLGLQLLFDESDEAPGAPGLGLFAGRVVRLEPGAPDSEGRVAKIPHMGWNALELSEGASRSGPLSAVQRRSPYVYFVHSYHAVPADRSIVCATATHGPNTITAAIQSGPVFATQFHPEKSQATGIAILAELLRERG